MLSTRSFNYQNAVVLSNELSLPELWYKLHEDAFIWPNLPISNIRKKDREKLNKTTLKLLGVLGEVLAERWFNLCIASGITVYGAVALSWCQDAPIEKVWDAWEASGFPLKSLPEYERPATFINPALLPNTNSLSQIIAFCPDKTLPICAMIAALKEPLDFDLPVGQLEMANPQLASFLKSRMEQNPDRTPEQNDLINIWTQTIKGTEWEV